MSVALHSPRRGHVCGARIESGGHDPATPLPIGHDYPVHTVELRDAEWK